MDEKGQNNLIKVVQMKLDAAFRSGKASPNDVDEEGQTLLHGRDFQYQRLSRFTKNEQFVIRCSLFHGIPDPDLMAMYRFLLKIIKELVATGVKTDYISNRFL